MRTCPDSSILQDDSVVNEADVLGGCGRARSLLAQQVQDLGSQHSVLTVLDELTKVGQTCEREYIHDHMVGVEIRKDLILVIIIFHLESSSETKMNMFNFLLNHTWVRGMEMRHTHM